jgi:energy-coupling factor transport system permease protein
MAFRLYVYVAVVIVVLRLGMRILFGAGGPTVLMRLPSITLPGVLNSVRLFGPVSAEALLAAGVSGLQLAAMIIAVGAANALANPKRLLAGVPGALYEWGTVVVIALSVFPQLAESLVRVRRARQLRAETGRRAHLIRTVAMPVLSDALDRSLLLAGAMDSRGYGRRNAQNDRARRVASALLIVSSLAVAVGVYGLLDTGLTPLWMGTPMVVLGLLAGLLGLRVSGRRVIRTRYRPDRLAAPEWVVLASGVVAGAGVVVAGVLQPWVLHPPVQSLGLPPASWASLLVVMVLVIPAFATPPPEAAPASDAGPPDAYAVDDDRAAQLRGRPGDPAGLVGAPLGGVGP